MRLNTYINEGRSRPIDSVEKTKLLGKCSDAIYNKYPIFRGFDGRDEAYVVNPSDFTRKSANTENYYTVLIDNLPDWKDYPKRSKSIICTTDSYKARRYGNVYKVYPVDGSKIGVCPSDDIWPSFQPDISWLYQFNNDLDRMSVLLNQKIHSNSNVIFSDLIKFFDDIQKKKGIILDDLECEFEEPIFQRYIKSRNTFKELVEDALNPTKHGFDLYTPKTFDVSGDHEVWTDGMCVLVRQDR